MLKQQLIHPTILRVLGAAGHHGKVLIADGHYPASTKRGPNAEVVHLNLSPGVVTCDVVLRAVLSAIPVEAIHTMMYQTEGPYALSADPPVWADYRRTIDEAGIDLELEPIEKWAFYDSVTTDDHVLTIQTADTQTFENVLLTFGAQVS